MTDHRWTPYVLVALALAQLAELAVPLPGVEWPPASGAVLVPGYVLLEVPFPRTAADGSRPGPGGSGRGHGGGIDGGEERGSTSHSPVGEVRAEPTAGTAGLRTRLQATVGGGSG